MNERLLRPFLIRDELKAGKSRGERIHNRLGEIVESLSSRFRQDFEATLHDPEIARTGINRMDQYMEKTNQRIDSSIDAVRFGVNRLDDAGITAMSIRVIPIQRGKAVDLSRRAQQRKGPTFGLKPKKLSDKEGIQHVHLGYQPGDSTELVHGLNRTFRAAVVPDKADIKTYMTLSGQAAGQPLVVSPKNYVVMRVPAFDLKKLEASGIPFALASEAYNSEDTVNDAWWCEYEIRD